MDGYSISLAAAAPALATAVDDVADLVQRMTAALISDGRSHWLRVRPEIYAIVYDDAYLLFAPLRGQVLQLTRAGLARLLLRPNAPINECIAGPEQANAKWSTKWADDTAGEPPAIVAVSDSVRPVQVTLSLTSACQLACTYCYIHGGDQARNMPWAIAEAAIRLVSRNAAEAKLGVLPVLFHGQGEPTASWPLFTRAVAFAEHCCRESGQKVAFSVMTNGILTERKVRFLAEHHFSVGLSFDGPKSAQDAQRPMRRGGGSFRRVMETCRLFAESGIKFGIRSTVTPRSVAEMPDFVRFVHDHTSCRSIDFEPVTDTGRACDGAPSSSGAESIDDFGRAFELAREVGAGLGVAVSFAACHMESVRSSFCGATGTNLSFCVATDGLVSSCYEVLSSDDPRASVFAYGAFDMRARTFRFNEAKAAALRSLDVTKIACCSGCFARWSCAGGCLAKVAYGGMDAVVGEESRTRCRLTREITRSELALLIRKKGE